MEALVSGGTIRLPAHTAGLKRKTCCLAQKLETNAHVGPLDADWVYMGQVQNTCKKWSQAQSSCGAIGSHAHCPGNRQDRSMLEDQFGDPSPRPKLQTPDWSDFIRMQQGGEDLTRMSVGLRFGYRNGTAPIGPFTLQDADHAGWIGG